MNLDTAELRSPGFPLGLLIRVGRGPTSLKRQIGICLIALLVLLTLGYLDSLTPRKVHFGLLYVVPVLFAAWYGGRTPGNLLNVIACGVWFKAGRPDTDGPGILINAANLLIRSVFYGLLVELLVLLRSVGQSLETSVRQRTAELRQEISDRLRAQESLRILAAQLSAAEDVERRRLAYDIHDALSQMLGLIKMNLETVVAETAIDTRQFDRLSDVVKTVDDLIRQTREMTFDLHPSMLDHFGLVPTLETFAQDYSRRTHSEVTTNEAGERADLPASLASYLFRAVKEVVNNAIRHGNASEIIIAFHWEPGHLRIVVDDNGSGFEPPRVLTPHARRGLGLAGIDERLTSFGGKLDVESQPGGGARIILEIPVGEQQRRTTAVTNERALV